MELARKRALSLAMRALPLDARVAARINRTNVGYRIEACVVKPGAPPINLLGGFRCYRKMTYY